MTHISHNVKKILEDYQGFNPGLLSNLAKILMHGKLGGTGKIIVLPVDQGFEHGPVLSFIPNPPAYDPCYHMELAIEAGLSAYAAPLGMLEVAAAKYPNGIPLILKMNSANSVGHASNEPDQAFIANLTDALRLGCSAVGLTIYPGSDNCNEMIEEASEVIAEAKSLGLPTVVWSYPRGVGLTKTDETAIDVIAYAAQIASLIGAHIIKVKIPSNVISSKEAKSKYKDYNVKLETIEDRIRHIKTSAFNGKRIVLFSGGASKGLDTLYEEVTAIKNGGGNGSIIGRNTFQRPKNEAIDMLKKLIQIYSV